MSSKWIEDLPPCTPPAQAARRVLEVRLEHVRHSLSQATEEPEKDPEYVHQLRVGTRRARAALDTFRHWLRRRVYRSARKRLRAIRRAAGEARDWDVFLITLAERRREREQDAKIAPGLHFLAGYAHSRRQLAQVRLNQLGNTVAQSFGELVSETVAGVRASKADDQRTLADLARPILQELLVGLETAAACDVSDYQQLHRVRIAGKRLRYGMEIFGQCFPSFFKRTLYPSIEEMQGILGRANDSHVAAGFLGALCQAMRSQSRADWQVLGPGINALRRFHDRRLPRERRNFMRWWQKWQKLDRSASFRALLKEKRGPENE
jgi:CHAD domain-containing protein